MKTELKQAFCSRRFALSFVVMFICFLGYSLPSRIFSGETIIEYQESALQLSIGGIFFGGVMLLMPFCSSLVFSIEQVEELRTGVFYLRMIYGRSINKYAAHKATACACSAAIAMALAFLLHALLWNLIAMPVDPSTYPSHEIGFAKGCLYYDWYRICYALPVYASMAVGIAFTASIWSIVALAVAVWLPDRLLVMTVPACIYYLWNTQLIYYLFGVRLPDPATLYNDGLTIRAALECTICYLCLLALSLTLYRLGLKRRACHG